MLLVEHLVFCWHVNDVSDVHRHTLFAESISDVVLVCCTLLLRVSKCLLK